MCFFLSLHSPTGVMSSSADSQPMDFSAEMGASSSSSSEHPKEPPSFQDFKHPIERMLFFNRVSSEVLKTSPASGVDKDFVKRVIKGLASSLGAFKIPTTKMEKTTGAAYAAYFKYIKGDSVGLPKKAKQVLALLEATGGGSEGGDDRDESMWTVDNLDDLYKKIAEVEAAGVKMLADAKMREEAHAKQIKALRAAGVEALAKERAQVAENEKEKADLNATLLVLVKQQAARGSPADAAGGGGGGGGKRGATSAPRSEPKRSKTLETLLNKMRTSAAGLAAIQTLQDKSVNGTAALDDDDKATGLPYTQVEFLGDLKQKDIQEVKKEFLDDLVLFNLVLEEKEEEEEEEE
jgi:hypothetical protein